MISGAILVRIFEQLPYGGICGEIPYPIPQEVKGDIGLVLTGYLEVPADGIYTFTLLSDDGSTLMLDGELLGDNDGAHSPVEIIVQKALKAGLHPIEVRYFDCNGGTLQMGLIDGEGKRTVLPPTWLKHE